MRERRCRWRWSDWLCSGLRCETCQGPCALQMPARQSYIKPSGPPWCTSLFLQSTCQKLLRVEPG